MRRLGALAFVLALGLSLAGCGGGSDSDAPMTLEEYFQALQVLTGDLHTGEAPILSTLSNSQSVQELKGALQAYPAVVDPYRQGLGELRPPQPVAEAHTNALTAGEQFARALESAIRDTRSTTTADEFFSAANLTDIVFSSQAMAVGCNELQQVADDHDVTVDLGCETGTES